MSYAIVDYSNKSYLGILKVSSNTIGEISISMPPFKNNKSKKYALKLVKLLNKNKIENVVLSEKLLSNSIFCGELIRNRKYIVTGRRLYKVLLCRMLKDIAKQMDVSIQKLKIVLLVKEYSLESMDLINNIAKNVKSLIIVTNDADRYRRLAEELFEKYGIILKVFEKEKTNFKYAHIVINIDFLSEELNKIAVNPNSLVICGFAKKYKPKNNFNGIVIKYVDIISGREEIPGVDNLAICEVKIYNYLRKIKENDRVFEREGYRINGYFGENGKIMSDEFLKLGKNILDK